MANIWDPVRLPSDLTQIPDNRVWRIAWSPDDRFLACGITGPPYIVIYERDHSSFFRLPTPDETPNNTALGCGWSSDGRFLAIGSLARPHVTIYERFGREFVKLPDPLDITVNGATSASFSPDGRFLVVGQFGSPYIYIYERFGTTFNKLPDPETLPAGRVFGAHWAENGKLLILGNANTPCVTLYSVEGNTFTYLDESEVFHRGSCEAALSPDQSLLAVENGLGEPRLTLWERNGNDFTNVTDIDTVPDIGSNSTSWSPDGRYLALGVSSPSDETGVYIYERHGKSLRLLPQIDQISAATDVSWSNSGEYFAVAQQSTPYLSIFRSNRIATSLAPILTHRFTHSVPASFAVIDPAPTFDGSPYRVSISPDGQNMCITHSLNQPHNFPAIFKKGINDFVFDGVSDSRSGVSLPDISYQSQWSPDGQFLAVAASTFDAIIDEPKVVTIYQQSGDVFIELEGPPDSDLPGDSVFHLAWSPDSAFLAISHSNSPHFIVYHRVGLTFTKVEEAESPPPSPINDLAWSPSGNFLAVAHVGSPYIAIYHWEGSEFVRLSDPTTLPTGHGRTVSFSPDGTLLVVGHNSLPFMTVYEISGTTFTKIDSPPNLVIAYIARLRWSPNGRFLAVGASPVVFNHSSLFIYEREGNTLNLLESSDLAAFYGEIYSLDWSGDSETIVASSLTAPYVRALRTRGVVPTAFPDDDLAKPTVPGGKLYSFSAGTDTPLATFTDHTGQTPNTNPVVLDSNGQAEVWLGPYSYKFQLDDAAGVTQWVFDNIDSNSLIADGQVTLGTIEVGAIIEPHIVDGAVSRSKIAPGAVTETKIEDESLTQDHFTSDAFSHEKLKDRIELVYATNAELIPQFDWKDPRRLPDVSQLPNGRCKQVTWSPRGRYLCVTHENSPYFTIYRRLGNKFTSIPDPLPTEDLDGEAVKAAWYPSGEQIAISHFSGRHITLYRLFEGELEERSGAISSSDAPIGGSNNVDIDFSDDGRFLAVGDIGTPFVRIYQMSDGPDKLSNPSDLPTSLANGVAFSHSGEYLATSHNSSPYVTIFKRGSGTSFSKLSNPSELPFGPGGSFGCSWSPDDKYLSLWSYIDPYIEIYERDGDTFTKQGHVHQVFDPSFFNGIPSYPVFGVSWHPSGRYFCLTTQATNHLIVYEIYDDGTKVRKVDSPSLTVPFISIDSHAEFSPDGRFLAVALPTTPFLAIFETGYSLPTNGIVYLGDSTNV